MSEPRASAAAAAAGRDAAVAAGETPAAAARLVSVPTSAHTAARH